jgi:hypothetical protein
MTSSKRMSGRALNVSDGFSGMDKNIEIIIRFETLYLILEIDKEIPMSLFYCWYLQYFF